MFSKIKGGLGMIASWIFGTVFRQNAQLKLKSMISNQEVFYTRIELWKMLYMGMDSDFHKRGAFTISKQSHKHWFSKKSNTPKKLSSHIAKLIFTDKVKIEIDNWDEANDFLQNIITNNDLLGELQSAAEKGFALGGSVAKIVVEGGKSKYTWRDLKIDFVDADQFVPISWDTNKKITSASFISYMKKEKDYFTIIETHKRIGNDSEIVTEVYKSRGKMDKGSPVMDISSVLPGIDKRVVIKNVKKTFAYFKPRITNNIDLTVPHGISIFANSLDLIQIYDLMLDTLYTEFDSGRKKILIPEWAMKEVIDKDTGRKVRYFDSSDPTYQSYNANQSAATQPIQEFNFELRVEEHKEALKLIGGMIASNVGFSPDIFSMDSTTSKTATEVVSDKSDTWMTKVNHEHNVKVWIQEIIQLLINAASLYDIQGFKKIKEIGDGENEYQILIKFDDSIIIDDQKNKENDIVLLDKGMLPKYRYLMRNEGLTEEEAKLWIEEADAEMQSMFDDPSDDSEEAEWIENYLMNNPDSNESEARKKYNEQLEG